MTIIRIDPLTQEEIIFVSGRKERPSDLKSIILADNQAVIDCPFCPGNEMRTPLEIDAINKDGSWKTRVFLNKYPIFQEKESGTGKTEEVFVEKNLAGIHQIIVDHPNHQMTFFQMEQVDFFDLLLTYQKRYLMLREMPDLRYILLFKNYLSIAGASLTHPHSQVIGSVYIPQRVKKEFEGYISHFEKNGHCIFCQLIEKEHQSEREVFRTPHFQVINPFASRFPFETWLLPLKHLSGFESLEDELIMELAKILMKLFRKYYLICGDMPFNMYIHNQAFHHQRYRDFHWHIEIVPRLNRFAGYEVGGGTLVNTIMPEEATCLLKRAIINE